MELCIKLTFVRSNLYLGYYVAGVGLKAIGRYQGVELHEIIPAFGAMQNLVRRRQNLYFAS